MKTHCLALVFAAGLTGCYSSEYHPLEAGGVSGYSSREPEPGVYEVWYRGPNRLDANRRAGYVMLRAAELAEENGYPYFEVLDSRQAAHSRREHLDPQKLFVDGTSTSFFKIRGYKTAPDGPHRNSAETIARFRAELNLK